MSCKFVSIHRLPCGYKPGTTPPKTPLCLVVNAECPGIIPSFAIGWGVLAWSWEPRAWFNTRRERRFQRKVDERYALFKARLNALGAAVPNRRFIENIIREEELEKKRQGKEAVS